MPRPKNVKAILATLTPTQIDQLRILLKEDPKIARLEKRLAALDEKRADIIAEIEALKTGVGEKGRGRPSKGKPGRPKKQDSISTTPKRRGRPPKVKNIEAVDIPRKRGRPAKPGVSTPEMRAAVAKNKVRTPEEQARIDERMAKTREARGKKTK